MNNFYNRKIKKSILTCYLETLGEIAERVESGRGLGGG